MTTPKVPSFTEEELDEMQRQCAIAARHLIEAGLRHTAEIVAKAADAIAALRRERVPREPTQAMTNAGKHAMCELGLADGPAANHIWRSMHDAAPASEGDKDG